ncbi:MAG: hypothetical protein HXX13_16920 [Bacteroidetes bacterium]|nr:hypothetical protein [Bacteroidota bacterium]
MKSYFSRIDKKQLPYLLVLLFGIITGSIGYFLYGNIKLVSYGDSSYYFQTAELIKANLNNLFTSQEIGIGESLNAIIIGILIKLPFNDFYEIFFFQILIYGFTGLFLFKFTEEYIGQKSAWIVAFFYLVNNKHWQHIYIMKPGVWVVFWISLVLLYAIRLFKDPGNRKLLIIYSLLIGALILTDMRYIPHIAALSFMILLPLKPFGLAFKKMLAIAGLVLLTITPWIVREYYVFDRFIFISDVNTIVFQQTFAPEKFKESWVYKGEIHKLDSIILPDGRNLQHEGLIKEGKLSREQVNYLVAKENSKSNFRQRLEYGLSLWVPFKFRYSYEPKTTYKPIQAPASKANNLNRIIMLGILYPFFFIGLFVIARKKDMFGLGLILMLIFHFFLHMFTYTDWRYLLPVLPVITLISVMGLNLILEKLKPSYRLY